MRNILVATDLSARSDRALDRAVLLARERQARLTVLHVVADSLAPAETGRRQREAEREIAAYLAARGGGQEAAVSVLAGEPSWDILREAERSGADLIVLGAHRVAPEDDTFRNSTAWNVLRESSLPVLLVKDPALGPYRRLAVGFDFSGYSEAALRLALAFRPERLDALHAYTLPFEGGPFGAESHGEMREQRGEELDQAIAAVLSALPPGLSAEGVELRRSVCKGEPRCALRQECEALGSELLTIGSRGRTGLAHAVFGSVAESLLRNPPCDVAAVRAADGHP